MGRAAIAPNDTYLGLAHFSKKKREKWCAQRISTVQQTGLLIFWGHSDRSDRGRRDQYETATVDAAVGAPTTIV